MCEVVGRGRQVGRQAEVAGGSVVVAGAGGRKGRWQCVQAAGRSKAQGAGAAGSACSSTIQTSPTVPAAHKAMNTTQVQRQCHHCHVTTVTPLKFIIICR